MLNSMLEYMLATMADGLLQCLGQCVCECCCGSCVDSLCAGRRKKTAEPEGTSILSNLVLQVRYIVQYHLN